MSDARDFDRLSQDVRAIWKRLENTKEGRINKSTIKDLMIVLKKINEVNIFSGLPSKLQMDEEELRVFFDDSEKIDTEMALLVAKRAVYYIRDKYPTSDLDALDARAMDMHFEVLAGIPDDLDDDELDAWFDRPPAVRFTAQQWRSINPTADMKKKIAELMDLLESISDQIKKSNYVSEGHGLTLIERNTIITLLETVLALLRNPVMAERGILRKLEKSLGEIGKKAIEKEVGQGIGEAAASAKNYIRDIIVSIFT